MSATTAIAAAVRILSHARDLQRSHTQGEDLDDATENAREALVLYVEGLREDGRSVDSGVVRRTLANPA